MPEDKVDALAATVARIDERTLAQGREIGQIRQMVAGMRQPWTAVASSLAALAALALAILK